MGWLLLQDSWLPILVLKLMPHSTGFCLNIFYLFFSPAKNQYTPFFFFFRKFTDNVKPFLCLYSGVSYFQNNKKKNHVYSFPQCRVQYIHTQYMLQARYFSTFVTWKCPSLTRACSLYCSQISQPLVQTYVVLCCTSG